MDKCGRIVKMVNKTIKEWWQENDNIFLFNFEISLWRFIFVKKILTVEVL